MQTVNDLLDAAKQAQGLETDMALAKALGVGRAAVSAWRHGSRLPDPVACATLAGLTGEPLAKVLGIVGEARAVSREEKAVWRKLAATAMGVLLGIGLASPGDAHGATTGFKSGSVYTLCEITSEEECPLRAPRTAPVIASEETPRRQPTTAHLSTNNRPRFVPPPRKRPDERATTDNPPALSQQLANRSRRIGGPRAV